MKLSIRDRVNITLNLPSAGNREAIKNNVSIKNKLKLSKDEYSGVSIIGEQGMTKVYYSDQEKANEELEFDLSSKELNYLKSVALNIDRNGAFTEENLSTFEKFLDLE